MKNMNTSSTTSTSVNAPKFFVDHKKGEVAELMNLLRNPNVDRDINKKKDIVKRVIAYMTLGVDVSKLFHEMVKASYTDDIVMKKMIFLYIVNYADESESAILAINTFLKDLKNTNPKIRGLALRRAYEYFANSLYDSLKDSHPYVRKTAVMALLKVYHLNSKLISEKDIDTLYEMIKDKDNLVVMNTLYVLNEILKKEGGIAISGKMITHLLNILREFNEWGQNMVLELVSRYTPKDEEQLYSILNVLEDKLKHSCAAIVLACTRVFINFTKNNEFIYGQVLRRLRDPLVTLMTSGEISGNNELSYVVLSHIYVIILKGGRSLFAEIFKKFFVKFEEPLYIKKLKLEILIQVANENNYLDILNEMEEYVNDVNSTFAKHTIKKIGSLALRVDQALKGIVNLLQSLLHRNVDYIVAETLVVLQSILRKFPDVVTEFLRFLEPSITVVNNDQRGLSALIWILGEFGDKLDNSTYIFENLLENFSEEIQSSQIIYSFLLSGCKLFFKNPGEMQIVLGRIFEMVLRTYHDVDLRDRTYYFYNLMEKDIELAQFVICGEGSHVDNFYSDLDDEYLDQIYSQFNTLSVIYNKPEEKFVKSSTLEDGDVSLKNKNYDNMYDENEHLDVNTSKNGKLYESEDGQRQGQITKNNLIDTADLISIPSGKTNFNQSGPTTQILSCDFESSSHPVIDEENYQQMWTSLNQGTNRSLKMSALEIDAEEFEKYLDSEHVYVKARGEVNGILKIFAYSYEANSNSLILLEMNLDFANQELQYTVKSQMDSLLPKYEDFILKVIGPIL